MTAQASFIILVIVLAFVFDFINGFHDASNSIATIVTTGVLSPRQAVLWAAFFNFIAFIFFNLMVAKTIGAGLIDTNIVTPQLILSALAGAIFWNLLTWFYGLPSSSSHALIGGIAGAAIAKVGFKSLKLPGFLKVFSGILFAPLLGIFCGFILMFILKKLFKEPSTPSSLRVFKGFQLLSSAFLSLTHGGNDAQKTMGIIALLLFSASWLGNEFYIPLWVVISCQFVISLGTLAGGWRIVHTLGTKITELNPMRGCAAESGAALIIYLATDLGIPVSTTHTVTGAIAGVGLLKGLNSLQIQTLKRIFLSWIFTIPATALISGSLMFFLGA